MFVDKKIKKNYTVEQQKIKPQYFLEFTAGHLFQACIRTTKIMLKAFLKSGS